ncbi:MAG: hypothetical protein AB8C46_05855 [Burkholderiaceae bacterium]
MNKRPSAGGLPLVALMLLAMLTGSPSQATDAGRGKLLYENTCGICHESTLHLRERRKARSFEQIQVQVVRWSTAAKAKWTLEEIQDVTDYLNATYYRYPCAPEQCSFSPDK